MSLVLAAIDDSAATAPVIHSAQWFAALFDLDVRAVYVSDDDERRTACLVADAAGTCLETRRGDPVRAIRTAAAAPEVRALAIGTRRLPGHGSPAGHVALDLIRCATKPTLVVSPDALLPRPDRLRVLAPLDEHSESASALRGFLKEIKHRELELVLLRVFEPEHVPRFDDHGRHNDALIERLVHHGASTESARTRIEMRVGFPASTILDVERGVAADLVVLAWGCDLSGDRASVIKRLLTDARTALLLLPMRERTGVDDFSRRDAASRMW